MTALRTDLSVALFHRTLLSMLDVRLLEYPARISSTAMHYQRSFQFSLAVLPALFPFSFVLVPLFLLPSRYPGKDFFKCMKGTLFNQKKKKKDFNIGKLYILVQQQYYQCFHSNTRKEGFLFQIVDPLMEDEVCNSTELALICPLSESFYEHSNYINFLSLGFNVTLLSCGNMVR